MNPKLSNVPDATSTDPANANPHAGTASSTRRAVTECSGVVTRIIDAPDVVLVGSGIMSSTVAVMLKRLDPRLRVQMVEVAPELAREASDGWNNAGTGHAGVCEMSYTPTRDPDGRVPIARALRNWSLVRYLVTQGLQNMDDRIQALREYYPNARSEHWLEIVQTCLPHMLASAEGRERMRQMIPTFDIDLKQPGNVALFEKNNREASEKLQILSNQ